MSDTPKLWTDDEIKELWQRQERELAEARAECERLREKLLDYEAITTGAEHKRIEEVNAARGKK